MRHVSKVTGAPIVVGRIRHWLLFPLTGLGDCAAGTGRQQHVRNTYVGVEHSDSVHVKAHRRVCKGAHTHTEHRGRGRGARVRVEAQRQRRTEAEAQRQRQRHRGTEAERQRGTEAERHRGTEAEGPRVGGEERGGAHYRCS